MAVLEPARALSIPLMVRVLLAVIGGNLDRSRERLYPLPGDTAPLNGPPCAALA